MTIFLTIMLFINFTIGGFLFRQLYHKRKLFQDRFAMIVAITATGSLSLSASLLIYFLFPVHIAVVSLATVVVGGLIGTSFGSLVTFQSLLAGFFHGTINAVMGTMIGAVVRDPTLCGLPTIYLYQVDHNTILVSIFGTFIVIITSLLVHYSFRV